MREQSKKVYEYMVNQKAKLQDQLADLRAQQKNIDERIADATIVLLGLDRMIGTLEPEIITALVNEAEQAAEGNVTEELQVPSEFRRDEVNYEAAAE